MTFETGSWSPSRCRTVISFCRFWFPVTPTQCPFRTSKVVIGIPPEAWLHENTSVMPLYPPWPAKLTHTALIKLGPDQQPASLLIEHAPADKSLEKTLKLALAASHGSDGIPKGRP
jgi:hypothetical protein